VLILKLGENNCTLKNAHKTVIFATQFGKLI